MDDFTNLLVLCVLMFILTYAIGYLPMIFKLSPTKMELISIFGAGFLLGTAFIVIVPEGLSVLMESSGILHAPHSAESRHLNEAIPIEEEIYHQLQDLEDDAMDVNVLRDRRLLDRNNLNHNHHKKGNHHHNHDHNHHEEDDGEHTHTHDPIVHSVFRRTGCLICFGFIFMMAVEKLSAHSHGHDHSYHHKQSDQVSEQLLDHDDKSSHSAHGHDHHDHGSSDIVSFMIGLLTHSAVDGIALGAVSAEGNASSLSILVFIALMAHKGPAAISMVAFLNRKLKASLIGQVHEQRIKKTVMKQLAAFSAAAPIFAILTYFVLHSVGWIMGNDEEGENASNSEMLGYCLLFSGGTFLYVVTLHILPEIKEWRPDESLKWTDLLVLTVGCVVPSLFEHSH